MEQLKGNYQKKDKIFSESIYKIQEIFKEIESIQKKQNSELFYELDKSQISSFIDFVNCKLRGDSKFDFVFKIYKLLSELERKFDNASTFRSSISTEKEIYLKFKKEVEEFFKVALAVYPKYSTTPLEYYDLLFNKKLDTDKYKPNIYYSENLILRFDKNQNLIIFPLLELLEIHLTGNTFKKLGKISLEDENIYRVYFKREYLRSRGPGKDRDDLIEHYTFCPDTLQLDLFNTDY